MKKLAVFLGFLMATFISHAQSTYGVHANVIGANINVEDDDEEMPTDMRISYKVGIVANYPLSKKIALMPQLNYVSKGANINESGSLEMFGFQYSYSMKGYLSLNYLELPINFVFTETMKSGNVLFVGAGPSISMGLSGKSKIDYTETSNGITESYTESAKIKFDGKESNDDFGHLKRMEFGANLLLGYRFANGLFMNVHFNQGLNNIGLERESRFTTNYLGFGVGYFFSKK